MSSEYRNPGSRCVRLAIFFFSLIVVLVGAGTLASAGQQEAEIIGQVADESGAVLPGVLVTATSPSLQVPNVSSVTNERGEYRLSQLPIGTYEVTYELQGFQSVRRTEVRLTIGFTAKLDVQLKVGSVSESLTVSAAAPVVDVTATSTQTQLTKESLESVPSSRSGLISLMALAPGVRPNLDVGGNIFNATINFHAFGQNGESWQAIEGIVTTSPNSGNQGGNYWDSNGIEEANVKTVGSDADTPVRGISINAIVRTGGNEFHGSGFLAGTNQSFESNPGIAGNPINKRYDVNGDVGGHLLRDKIWFYTSGRYRAETDGLLGCVQDNGGQCISVNSLAYSTSKLTWQVNPSNRLIGFAMVTYKTTLAGGSPIVSYDSRTYYSIPIYTNKVEWEMVKGKSLVTSLQFGYFGWDRLGTTGYSSQLGATDLVTGQVTGLSTGASFGPQPEYRIQPRGSLTWYKPDWAGGNHTIKVNGGYQWIRTDIGYGEYHPSTLQANVANYSLLTRSGSPYELQTYNYPVLPTDMVRYMDLSAEDSWTIGRRVTLNLGVRFAHNPGFIPAQCSPGAAGVSAPFNPPTCYPEQNFNTWNPVVPRLHAAYDITGDGKTLLSGGWGRFAHMRQTDEVALANHNYPTSSIFKCLCTDPSQANLDPNGPQYVSTSISGTTGALADGVINPSEKEPLTDEFMVQFQRELMPSFAVRVTGVYSRNRNTYMLENLLRPPSAYTLAVTNPIPNPNGVGTTGQTLTYYDYPSSLAGVAFQEPTLINNSAADASYKTVEFAATKRLSHGWQFDASYSLTQLHIPIVPNTGTPTSLTIYIPTDDPNVLINNTNYTKEWLGRVSAVYQAPWGVGLSLVYESRSGDPEYRTVNFTGGTTIPSITLPVSPLGTYRLPEVNVTNFRAEKTIALGSRQKLTLRANLYNAFNSQVPTSVNLLTGSTFFLPLALVPPRIFELSGVFRF